MKRLIKRAIILVIVLGLAGAAGAWYLRRGDGQPLSYRTAQVKRGDLTVSISATGTVEPEEVIDVGAQIAGQILRFGKDKNGKTIDYGSVVEEGMILAEIDDSLYAADAAQSAAQVQQAKAALQRSEADIDQMKAKLYQAQRDWERAQKLENSEALAEVSYDAYQSAYKTAKANLAVGEAAIMQARATVAQAEATLQRARRNLTYCTIKAPVKGVIIDRRVNIGQTVVASLNAPSLFLIAKDLRRMQVWVAVNEADIGRILPGQPVSFTADAYPDETFRGEVGKVRLNASMTQNVVTYTVEIITDNSSGRLLPYLTANVQFELDRRSNVQMVPNAALRWMPPPELIAPEFREEPSRSSGGKGAPKDGQQPTSRPAQSLSNGQKRGMLWVPQGDSVRPVRVVVGMSDGTMTEVQGDGVREGLEVVIGQQAQSVAKAGTSNPFTPQLPRGAGRLR